MYELKSNRGKFNKLAAREKVRVRNVSRLAQVDGQINFALKESDMREYGMNLLRGLEKIKGGVVIWEE